MAPTRRRYLAVAAGTLALAGCQSGSDESNTPTDTADPSPTSSGGGGTGPTVQIREHPDFGDILVDGEGMTLYNFDSDTRGEGASTCTGGCLDAWPALVVEGAPTAGDGVTASLATFEREDGRMQVAANGWPLYYFASDTAPGEVMGQGRDDLWWVLGPAGQPIRSTGAVAASPTDESSGRSGY